MAESAHKKLERVRPPRVNITYEVETGGAIELKELPFVMGVLGDFVGQPDEDAPKFKERKFVEVTPSNFDTVLAKMKPRAAYTVENKLTDEGGKIGVDLRFESLDDFSPERVAESVDPLKKLLDARRELANLRGKLQGNDKLEEILQETIRDSEKLGKLKDELGPEDDADEKKGDD